MSQPTLSASLHDKTHPLHEDVGSALKIKIAAGIAAMTKYGFRAGRERVNLRDASIADGGSFILRSIGKQG